MTGATQEISPEQARERLGALRAQADATLARVREKIARLERHKGEGKPAAPSDAAGLEAWDAMARDVAEADARLDEAGRALAASARARDGAQGARRATLNPI